MNAIASIRDWLRRNFDRGAHAEVLEALERHRQAPHVPAHAAMVHAHWRRDRRAFTRAVELHCEARGGARPIDASRPSDIEVGKRKTWHNGFGNQIVQPLETVEPTSVADVQAIVASARARGLRVRVAGGGWSFSDLVNTTGVLIGLGKLGGITRHAPPPGATCAAYVRVAAGETIERLNAFLDDHGLALENMPAFDGQKIVGAICTGVHGSGVELGPLANQVVSLVLVGGDARLYQIEPSEGADGAPREPGATLVRDDDVFHAAVVGLGAMGLVTSVTLRVRERYGLRETRTIVPWSEVKPRLFETMRAFRHYELLINPYRAAHGDRDCLETRRAEVPVPSDRVDAPKVRHYVTGLLEGSGLAAAVLVWFLGEFPRLTPFAMERALSLLAFGDDGYTDVAKNVLLLGDANELPAYSAECAVPLHRTIEAVEAMCALAEDAAATGDVYQSAPVGVRFVAGSPHFLAPQYGDHPFCMIEMPILKGTVGGFEILQRFEAKMRDFGGRSHWGELHQINGANGQLDALYPRLADWRKIRRRLDPDGVFSNALTDRCGL